MAEPPESGDALDRYAAIETSYRAERWSEVLERGNALLADLGTPETPEAAGLRERLQLLLGHTHLHGLGDRAAAARCYREVLAVTGDPRLRQSAEEELRGCEASAAAAPSAAAPWLEAAGSRAARAPQPLIPEVVEEPELIEVHQSDPRLAEDLELPLRESEPEDDPELRRGLMRVVLP
jgi:hypothetical protein